MHSSTSTKSGATNESHASETTSSAKAGTSKTLAEKSENSGRQRCVSPSESSSTSSASYDSVTTLALDDGIKAYIKIGDEHQVDLTPYNLKFYKNVNRKNLPEKAELIWRPSNKISEKQLDDYLNEMINERSFSLEQAIVMLSFNNHDIRKTLTKTKTLKTMSDEWTKEEKIMFEHAYWFHGKNFNKIKILLPHKSQACLVKYYYTWKKTRMQKSLMDFQMDLKQVNNTDQNGGISGSRGVNGDSNNENGVAYEELDLTEKSDDSDSVDDNFNSNLNKICCNCDFITPDLQSTPKGMLCNPCYDYYKDTGGLMRPDHLMNKPTSSGSGQNHGYLQSSAYRTNRYLNITNNNGGGITGTAGSVSSSSGNQDSCYSGQLSILSRDAKSFQKSLRKPPKGIYLNYEELVELVQGDHQKIFNQLNRRVNSLKKQAQVNKQDIDELVNTATSTGNEKFRNEINIMLSEIEERTSVQPSIGWTQKEVLMALRAFGRYGNNFEIISIIIPTKSESSLRAFYYYYKDIYNLEKIVSDLDEIEKMSHEISKEVNQNLADEKSS